MKNQSSEPIEPRKRGSGDKTNTGRKSARDEQATKSAFETFKNAQAKREVHKARIAELEEKKLRGDLIEVAEVKQQAIQAARAVREALLALPARVSAIIADQPEPVVRERLDKEVRKLLEGVADEL